MATSNWGRIVLFLLLAASAHAREAASGAECAQAALQPPIAEAKSAADRSPDDLRVQFRLADAWSEAGCFNDALQILTEASSKHGSSRELETRLRVARSVVGEEHFFDNLDRAEDQARVKRNAFRCTSFQDIEACNEIARAAPNDVQALANQGDALMKGGRSTEALAVYERAATLAPGQPRIQERRLAAAAQSGPRVALPVSVPPVVPSRGAVIKPPVRVARAQAQAPVERYSNIEPETRSH